MITKKLYYSIIKKVKNFENFDDVVIVVYYQIDMKLFVSKLDKKNCNNLSLINVCRRLQSGM